jgi:hypothetical protein
MQFADCVALCTSRRKEKRPNSVAITMHRLPVTKSARPWTPCKILLLLLLLLLLPPVVYGYDIEKINVCQDRFIVGRTQATLLLGDLESCRLSEIPWESDLSEKFYFEHEKVGSSDAATQKSTCFSHLAVPIHMSALVLKMSDEVNCTAY